MALRVPWRNFSVNLATATARECNRLYGGSSRSFLPSVPPLISRMAPTMESIELDHHDSLTPLALSSAIVSSQVNHNTVYFSSSCNHLSAKFIWNINGPNLEIYSYNNKCANRLLGLFEFGKIFDDASIAIAGVSRLSDRFEVNAKFCHPYKLVVILSLANNKSYICIVDVRLNSVLNTIDFPFNATCVEVILSGSPENTSKWPLARDLLCMNGILAVGCDGGLVFFIDLVLDSYSPVPLIPKQISYVTCNTAQIDLVNKRRTAIFHNQVICIPLNTDAKSKGKFHYRATDGNVLASFPSSQIYVSSLHFVPQLALLAVGYNFGGFHLYNLNLFKLDFSSGIQTDSTLLPVISFAFQVPEDDPKNFSYLWAVRGIHSKTPNVEHPWHKSCCTAYLYLLCYENKEHFDGYGVLYNTFKTCVDKFDMSLPFNPYDKNSRHHSCSKLLDMFTLHQVSSLGLNEEDGSQQSSPIDYNLLFIGWQARSSSDKYSSFFLLFDLNQWYNTQMPRQFCVDEDGKCPFLSIYSLSSLAKLVSPDSIQAIYFHNNSISKYSSNLFYHEIHDYPASLSFNITIASQTKICNASYLGLQKQLLNQFVRTGPRLLVDAENLVEKCHLYGLISPDASGSSQAKDSANEIVSRRELLMSIALENSLTPFLIATIREWSSDMMTNDKGCDLKHILDWLWKKVSHIKESIDALTTPLFDFSGCDLIPPDMAKLFSHEASLSAMSVLLKQLRLHATVLTQQGFDQLLARSEIVELIRSYLKIILLFKEFNLLPEQDAPNPMADSAPYYSYDRLAGFYASRRQEVSSINPSTLKKDDVLLIDTMMRHLEPHIGGVWQANSNTNCLYPPPNLHSLIRVFLVESVPLVYKESLLLYFLLDFCDHLEEQHVFMAQRIMVFMTSLHLSQGICNFIRGIWFLDHRRYPSALQFLTHPIVTSSLTEFKLDTSMFNAMVQRAVQLFLFANEYKSALIFSQCCGYFLVNTEKNENLYIQMLMLNGNLTGALDFQRQRRGHPNSWRMMHNLLFVCEKTNNLMKLCHIPLDDFEEEVFAQYLLASAQPDAKRILILYFILNNKLLDAISIVKEFAPEMNMEQEANRRILELTESYCSRIPHSLVNLAEEMANIISKSIAAESNWNERTGAVRNTSEEPTTIVINAKTRNIQKISSSLSIEKVLEMTESCPKRLAVCSPSSPSRTDRPRPIYLSPNISRNQSKVTKAKYQSGARDLLFNVLKTPDVMRRMDVTSSQFGSFSGSPRKTILKHTTDDSESDRMSSASHSKLKVSFAMASGSKAGTKKTPRRQPQAVTMTGEIVEESHNEAQFDDDDESSSVADQSELDDEPLNNNQDTDSDSSRQRARVNRKSLDTPTHRMKLRSKKP